MYLQRHILDEKGMSAVFKQNGKKIVKLGQKSRLLSSFKGKGCICYMYIKSRICPAYIFIDCLSSFYSSLHFVGPHWQK